MKTRSHYPSSKKIIISTMKERPLRTALLIAVAAGSSLIVLLPPQILRMMIDRYLIPGNYSKLTGIAIIYTICFPLIGLLAFLKEYLLIGTGQRIVRKMREIMSDKLEKLPAHELITKDSASITSLCINDVDSVNALFSEGLISLIIDSLKVVGILITIFAFSAALGVLVLASVPFLYIMMRHFRMRIRQAQTRSLHEMAGVNHNIAESIANRITIRMLHKERYMERKYEEVVHENYQTMNRIVFYDAIYSPVIQLITAALITAVFLIAKTDGAFGMTIGMVSAAVTLLENLFDPIDSVGMEIQSIQKGMSGMKNVDEFLALSEEEGKDAKPDISKGVQIEFCNVSFTYDKEHEILQGLDFLIEPGEKVVFAGRTGVGKTTLFRLITGILRPSEGCITVNGIPAWRIQDSIKRNLFGYVEQQFSFVSGTVVEQISLGDDNITMERIEEVMRFVGMHDSIMQLEHGYQTDVSDGKPFSRGQMQLLGIARAIVTDAPVLLLDEVTANLDEATEEEVVNVLKRAGEHRTVLSVSHRLGSIMENGRMIYLENGSVVYDGAPTEQFSGA